MSFMNCNKMFKKYKEKNYYLINKTNILNVQRCKINIYYICIVIT